MKVIICPGVHKTQLTDRFLNSLLSTDKLAIISTIANDCLVFPTDKYPAYSPVSIYQWLNKSQVLNEELLFVCFSAGVVGGIVTATFLQLQGVKIKGFVAIDGWGVPLLANFPIYRISHDYFTHWSSALLGTGKVSFYCDPAVPHLTLWESPELCQGWIVTQPKSDRGISKTQSSARDYLQQIILDLI